MSENNCRKFYRTTQKDYYFVNSSLLQCKHHLWRLVKAVVIKVGRTYFLLRTGSQMPSRGTRITNLQHLLHTPQHHDEHMPITNAEKLHAASRFDKMARLQYCPWLGPVTACRSSLVAILSPPRAGRSGAYPRTWASRNNAGLERLRRTW
jgi:hypothetical protein